MYVFSCTYILFHDLYLSIYACIHIYDASIRWRKSVHAECCCVLQCVAVCCGVLRCVASVLQVWNTHTVSASPRRDARAYIQSVALFCSVLWRVAVCCGVLQLGNSVLQRATRTPFLRHCDARACMQSVAVCCSALQVRCSVLHTHTVCASPWRACTHKETFWFSFMFFSTLKKDPAI